MKGHGKAVETANSRLLPVKLFLLIAAAAALQACSVEAYTSGCSTNDQIPQQTRDEIEEAAVKYVELLKEGPAPVTNALSSRGKAHAKPGAIEAVIARYKTLKILSDPAIAETYFVTSSSSTNLSNGIPCGVDDGRMAIVPRGGTATNALVLLTQDVPGKSRITHTLWMEHEDSKWLVRGAHFAPSAIAGLDSRQLWDLAKAQRSAGHFFNAHLLYVAARNLLDRGPFFQSSMTQDFNADFESFKPLPILQGSPPFVWTFEGETFEVSQVRYIGYETGQLALGIDRAPDAWTTDEDAEAANRRLIDGFDAAYPEWREVFDPIVATAIHPDSNKGWATVFSKETGYSKASADPGIDATPK
jgi:hypothetical protein